MARFYGKKYRNAKQKAEEATELIDTPTAECSFFSHHCSVQNIFYVNKTYLCKMPFINNEQQVLRYICPTLQVIRNQLL